MKKFFAVLLVMMTFAGSAFAEGTWIPVASYLATAQSPSSRDLLIHNPGTYSEVRVQVDSSAYMDRFDTISHILWGTQVDGLDGRYAAGEVRTASFEPRQVRFIRMYVRATNSGQPVHVSVWMR